MFYCGNKTFQVIQSFVQYFFILSLVIIKSRMICILIITDLKQLTQGKKIENSLLISSNKNNGRFLLQVTGHSSMFYQVSQTLVKGNLRPN